LREFRELVEAHQARVYSIAFRIVADTGIAEEIAQDVFLELHRNLVRIESEEHVLAWLRRVAVHRSTDALRRRSHRAEFAAEEYRDEIAPVAANGYSHASALSNRVEQLVATLPPTQRAVVLLRYQEDLLPDEIAQALTMPVATVKSHLQRALQLLRAKAQHTLKEYSRKEYSRVRN
jgi:RNA polymerase sigma-70 factor (ECF subfamily)